VLDAHGAPLAVAARHEAPDPDRSRLREILQPGKYLLGACFLACTSNRIDDFDVTYSTKAEHIEARSVEGLALDLGLSIAYRPIVSELYQLDTEIGHNYYDEVIGPEFRSTCRAVFARHSFTELQKKSESIEDEIEDELRRRTAFKHVEISAVTLERVTLPPEIVEAIRKKVLADAAHPQLPACASATTVAP